MKNVSGFFLLFLAGCSEMEMERKPQLMFNRREPEPLFIKKSQTSPFRVPEHQQGEFMNGPV
jgi:hypothetical protein